MTKKTATAPAKILLVDGTNALYRAFFAIPHLRAPDGTPTNAAYGFINMLAKVMREEAPEHAVVVFDAPGRTFRHAMFGDYKAGREATPEDLSAQFPMVRELLEAHRVCVVEVADFEADDVIATLAGRAPEGSEVVIVSTDKDLMQLVDDHVTLLDGMKDRRYGPTEVAERFGVEPKRVLDLRALVGDPSDNIPGVKGIGEKGAAKLIAEWGTLENLLEHADEVKETRARNALADAADIARLSKRLATLRTDAPLPISWGDAAVAGPDVPALRNLYEKYGFTRLIAGLEGEGKADAAERAATTCETLASKQALVALVEKSLRGSEVAVEVVFGASGPLERDVVGIAFATSEQAASFVPVGEGGLAWDEVCRALKPIFEAPDETGWTSRDTKSLQMLFAESGLEATLPRFDVELAGRLVDPTGARSLSALAAQHLERAIPSWEDLAGRGAKAKPAAGIPVPELSSWACAQVCAVAALRPVLAQRLGADGLEALYDEIELPLTRVLARMECAGIRIDEAGLERLAEDYENQLAAIEQDIYALAGEEFLISSPKQLQRILFEVLELPAVKKTKTGYSTDESVLEQLAADHALPAKILAYRHLAKLLSTYIVALPPLVRERSGRVHPTFNQLGAATGRLSATNPNVQNIPIRSEDGARIREMFIPAEGCTLVSADYSQVELRILAHFSEDEGLLAAFERGDDIHRQTAAEVAGIAPEDVTADDRARAKAINFGIIYGVSAFGLANQLGIAAGEAQETIDAYFDRYRGVRKFLDGTIASAKQAGFVTTLLGRRRYLPDLASKNRTLRQAAERMATNTVIQGTAADLIKRAMVTLDRDLTAQGFAARMLLQVHDELVFEAPTAELDRLRDLVRERMEGVAKLRVPLLVDVGSGPNWRAAH